MEEINILTAEDIKALLKSVEKECTLLIPDEKERLGELSFHLYEYDKSGASGNTNGKSVVFQIRYGMHKIFSKKHLTVNLKNKYLEDLVKVVCENKNDIKKAIIDYCQSQLETIISLELIPEFNKRFPYLFSYELKLCKARKKNQLMIKYGWPSLCVMISWTDEFGDFQEFMYPLMIDPESRHFQIETSKIISAYQTYRDQLV